VENFLDRLPEYLLTYGMRLVAALLIFFVGKWVARLVSRLIERFALRAEVDKTLASFLRTLAYALLLAFVIIAAVDKIGVKTTSFVAIIGAAGLAVGFALQGSLSNFAAGVILIVFKPFKVGQFIDAGGAKGTVQEIQIFSTVLSGPDNRRIVIPNSKITADKITNFSGIDKRRIDMVFGISYDDDIKKAKDILERIVSSYSRVLKDPAPAIAVAELADSSVNILCRPWVKPSDYGSVRSDMLEKCKVELEKNGISIPFPQTDVHVYEEKKAA